MTRVKCSVYSCDFWGRGDVCRAEIIWVKNMAGDIEKELASFRAEYADDLAANTSRQTCCETMRPRP